MSSYSFTPEAVNDLGGIYSYVAHEDMVAARQLLDRITELFRKLSTMLGLGRKRPELGQDIRSFPTGKYVIYYRVVEEGVQLMRIMHGARDVEKMFKQNSDQNDQNL